LSAHPELFEGGFVGVYLAQEIIHLRMAFLGLHFALCRRVILRRTYRRYRAKVGKAPGWRVCWLHANKASCRVDVYRRIRFAIRCIRARAADQRLESKEKRGSYPQRLDGVITACASFDRSRSLTAGFLGRPLVPSPSRNQDERKVKFFWKTSRSCDEDHPKGHCHFRILKLKR
jgi:hypothetical protein